MTGVPTPDVTPAQISSNEAGGRAVMKEEPRDPGLPTQNEKAAVALKEQYDPKNPNETFQYGIRQRENKGIIDNVDKLREDNIGVHRNTDGSKRADPDTRFGIDEGNRSAEAQSARDNLNQFLEGNITSPQLQEEVINILLEWPALQTVYGGADFAGLRPQQRAELLRDLHKKLKSEPFREQLKKICNEVGNNPANKLEDKITPLEEEYNKAQDAIQEAQTELHKKQQALQQVEQDLKYFEEDTETNTKGQGLQDLEKYTESDVQMDIERSATYQSRIEFMTVQINNVTKEQSGLTDKDQIAVKEKEIKALTKKQEQLIKERTKIHDQIKNRENLIRKRDSLIHKKTTAENEKNNAVANVTAKEDIKTRAETAMNTAKKERAALEQSFVSDLKSIPERALNEYMNERISKMEAGRKVLLENLQTEAKTQAEKALYKGMGERWISTYDNDGNPIPNKALILSDFNNILSRGQEGFDDLIARLLESGNRQGEIPFLQAHLDEAANADPDVAVPDTQNRKNAVLQWYRTLPPEVQQAINQKTLESLFAERSNNVKDKNPIRRWKEHPRPLTKNEERHYFEVTRKVYGGEPNLQSAVDEKVKNDPKLQADLERFRKTKNFGGILAILFGVLVDLGNTTVNTQ